MELTATPDTPMQPVSDWRSRYNAMHPTPPPSPAPAPAPSPAPWPTAPRVQGTGYSGTGTPPPPPVQYRSGPSDPSCVVRGTVVDLVDNRVIMLNGEQVETLVILLDMGQGHIAPIQCWGQKKCDFAKQQVGRVVDAVFSVGCQQRQVTLQSGEPTTIYNASLKLKTLVPA